MTYILELIDPLTSFEDLIPPIHLNLLQLGVMISDFNVKFLVELLYLPITSIDVKLSGSEFVTKIIEALRRESVTNRVNGYARFQALPSPQIQLFSARPAQPVMLHFPAVSVFIQLHLTCSSFANNLASRPLLIPTLSPRLAFSACNLSTSSCALSAASLARSISST